MLRNSQVNVVAALVYFRIFSNAVPTCASECGNQKPVILAYRGGVLAPIIFY